MKTKRGDVVRVASITLADFTATVTLKLWGDRTEWLRSGRLRIGDIVEFTHLRFKMIKPGHVEASSSWHTSAKTLWRRGSFTNHMRSSLQGCVDALLAWQHAGAYKGLSELAQESSCSPASEQTNFTMNKTTRLENMSDKECIDVVARLKIVYGAPTSRFTTDAFLQRQRTRTSDTTRFAILAEDGKCLEYALKLWGTFASAEWVADLKECENQLVECKRLLVKYCPFMDALVLNTSPHTTICVIDEDEQKSRQDQLCMGLTPSPMDFDSGCAQVQSSELGRGVDVRTWAKNYRLSKTRGMVTHSRRVANVLVGNKMRSLHRMLSVVHLLSCEVEGKVVLDANFIHWEPYGSVVSDNDGRVQHDKPELVRGSNVSRLAKTIESLVTRVCTRCGTRMNMDSNQILFCSRGCPPLATKTSSESNESWKWAYREGFCILQDARGCTASVHGGAHAKERRNLSNPPQIIAKTSSDMVQHLLLGIPPETLINEQMLQKYTSATGLDAQVVVSRQVQALMQPGICRARVVVDCVRRVDKNGQLLLDGCSYMLSRIDLL